MEKDKNKEYRVIVLERLMQFLFWVGLTYMLIKYGIPLLADSLSDLYQLLKIYMKEAPTEEQASLGLFFW